MPRQRILTRRSFNPKSFCTPRRRKIILIALKSGLTQTRSVELAGVSYNMYLRWLKKGRQQQNQTYYQFYLRVKNLLAREEKAALDIVRAAMVGGEKIKETKIVRDTKRGVVEITKVTKRKGSNWQAAAWRLERMDPSNYGRRFVDNIGDSEKKKDKSPEQIARDIKNAVDDLFESVPYQEPSQSNNASSDTPA